MSTLWFNDASANVLQIIVMKLMVYDKKLLKLTNVFSNDTGYKDIYEYATFNISHEFNIVSRDLVKSRIMPGIYGQKKNTFYEKIEKILLRLAGMTPEKAREIAIEVTNRIDDQIAKLGIHL